jgi:hypothetical protein
MQNKRKGKLPIPAIIDKIKTTVKSVGGVIGTGQKQQQHNRYNDFDCFC